MLEFPPFGHPTRELAPGETTEIITLFRAELPNGSDVPLCHRSLRVT